jgi:prepilin-type N-terminal cleavage/methylation domain-containing protein
MRRLLANQAFTLVELMLVLVTVGIIAAMAAPRYAGALGNYRARCAAQRVAVDLGGAAADADASSAPRTVRFDVKTNTYSINGAAPVRLDREPYDAALVSVDLGGDDTIAFDGYGAPDSGGAIVLRSAQFTRTVIIDPVTGRATVQ